LCDLPGIPPQFKSLPGIPPQVPTKSTTASKVQTYGAREKRNAARESSGRDLNLRPSSLTAMCLTTPGFHGNCSIARLRAGSEGPEEPPGGDTGGGASGSDADDREEVLEQRRTSGREAEGSRKRR
jgi:hypothetical protein